MQRKDMRLGTIYRIGSTEVGRITAFGTSSGIDGNGRKVSADHEVEVYDYMSQTFIPRKPVPSRDIDPHVLSRDAVLELADRMDRIAEVRRDRQYLDAFNQHYSTDAQGIDAVVTDVRQDRRNVTLLLCEYEAVTNVAFRTGSPDSKVVFSPADFRAFVDGLVMVDVPEPVANVAPPQYGGLLDTVHLDQLRREQEQEREDRNRAARIVKEVEERFKAEHEAKIAAGERERGRYYSPGAGSSPDRERFSSEVKAALSEAGLLQYKPHYV